MESPFAHPNYPPLTKPEGMAVTPPDPAQQARQKIAKAMLMQQLASRAGTLLAGPQMGQSAARMPFDPYGLKMSGGY